MGRTICGDLLVFCVGLGLFVSMLGAVTPSAAQVGPESASERGGRETPFVEKTDVVAVDRLVALEGTAGWLWGGKLPRNVGVDDFSAFIVPDDGDDGDDEERRALTPVSVERVVAGLPERAEPWTVVVLLDAELASTRTVRWAMGHLAERAGDLTALGHVTVWLSDADGALRTLLLPSDEPVRVKELLSRMALLTDGHDAVLQGRWDWVESGGGADEGSAVRAAHDEALRLRRALDARLLKLVEAGRGTGPRRLLLWVTDGFDLSPERFYGVPAAGGEGADGLRDHYRDVERALAADGWIAVSLRPPDEDPFRGKAAGVRIGKWRFVGFPPFIAGVRESERDPDKSEALLELGDQRLAAGDVEGAADAYDRAFYHFWGDPRTADRQAVALLRLSDCLETLGDRGGARKVRALAAELDPEAAARHLATAAANRPDVARLLDPDEPLRLLAEATSGTVVTEAPELDERLFELARRLRVTFQLPSDVPDGLYRVEIRRRGDAAPAPRWIRVGESPGVEGAASRRGADSSTNFVP